MSRIQLGQPQSLQALLATLRPILERMERDVAGAVQNTAVVAEQITRITNTTTVTTTVQQTAGPSNVQTWLGFAEAPDDSRVLFTPSLPLAVDSTGRVRALVWRGQALPLQTRTNPPPMGEWYWTGTQVRFNEADAPSTGEPLFLAVAVLSA